MMIWDLKNKYNGFQNKISPNTFKFLKVNSDLYRLFGTNLEKLAKLVFRYGGLTLFNTQLLNISYTKLFDLTYLKRLINKYLIFYLLK